MVLALTIKLAEVMRMETTGQWRPCVDVRRSQSQGEALAVATKARDMGEVHRIPTHPSEEIMQKTAETMKITTMGQ